MLRPVYRSIGNNCPLCMSTRFSLVNDEKVVNPPHIPTIKKSRHSAESNILLSEIPVKNPIIKLPAIFTARVPTGIEKKLI